ncbi:FUSC family protein [Arthrobacter bambusae]
MQLQTTTVLVLLIVGGAASNDAGLPGWGIVLATALVAGVCSAAADILRWTPSGCLFFVFAFAVSASTDSASTSPSLIAITAATTALFTVFVTFCGAAIELAVRRWCQNAIETTQIAPPSRLQPAVISAHASVCFIAAAAAGMLSLAGGLAHPYWAMVSAIVPVAGSTTLGQLTRSVHRLLGTFLGIGVTAMILFGSPDTLLLIFVLAVLTAGTELMVARNYGLAMLFLTPLTISMMFLNNPQPLGPILADRAVETCIGLAVVNVLIVLTHSVRHPSDRIK